MPVKPRKSIWHKAQILSRFRALFNIIVVYLVAESKRKKQKKKKACSRFFESNLLPQLTQSVLAASGQTVPRSKAPPFANGILRTLSPTGNGLPGAAVPPPEQGITLGLKRTRKPPVQPDPASAHPPCPQRRRSQAGNGDKPCTGRRCHKPGTAPPLPPKQQGLPAWSE